MYPEKKLKLFALIMISFTAVFSINHISVMATIGIQSIAFLATAAIMFFIPSALISAELGGMMLNNNGGPYIWVSSAFGQKTGLVTIWMEWFNNVIGYSATLAATITTFSYLGFPILIQNKLILFLSMLILLWGISLFNFLSIKKITLLNIVGGLCGMILPGLILIICSIFWFLDNKTLNIHFTSASDWIPSLNFATLALFVKTLNSYSGIQSVAFHTKDVTNARYNIPFSMTITVLIIFIIITLSTIALSIIIPQNELNAMSGMIQGITTVFHKFHLDYLSPIMVVCICVGIITQISTWVLGPARAMQEVASDGLIPHILSKTNNAGMPIGMLIAQAIIGSILSLIFLFMPSIQEAFAMIIALTAQFSVMMWIMIFISAIKLRYDSPQTIRPFRVGQTGNFAIIFWASLGITACGIGFFLGLFPPKFAHVHNITNYILLMLAADIIIISIPFIYIHYNLLYKKKA